MLLFKKLFFIFPFALCFLVFLSLLNQFFQNPLILLEFGGSQLILMIYTLVFLILASLFYTITVSLAPEWKIILPTCLLISFLPFLFISPSTGFILSPLFLLAFFISFIVLKRKLTTYLTFQAVSLLSPTIKLTSTLLILASSIAFYFTSTEQITKTGFSIPDSLIDLSLSISGADKLSTDQDSLTPSLPQLDITPEQLNYLKQNPQLLKQSGLDPSILDELDKPQTQNPSQSGLIKAALKSQLATVLDPYIIYIPHILTALFFLTFNWFASILLFIPNLLLLLIFYLLGKIGFTRYEVETREVKKLVI